MAKYLEWEAAKLENEQAHTKSDIIREQARRLADAAGTLRLHVHARSLPIPYDFSVNTFNMTCSHGNYATSCMKCQGSAV
jgi:hypothetical protein